MVDSGKTYLLSKEKIRDWLRSAFSWATAGLSEGRRDSLRILSKQMLCHRLLVGAVVSLNLGASIFEGGTIGIMGVAVSVLIGNKVDSVFGNLGAMSGLLESIGNGLGREGLFLLLVASAVVMQIMKNGFTYLATVSSIRLQYEVIRDLQDTATRHSMSFSYAEVNRHPSGVIAQMIDQCRRYSGGIRVLNELMTALFMFVVYVALMLMMSPVLTLAAVVVITIVSLSLKRIVVKLRHLGGVIAASTVDMGRLVFEYLNAQRLLRIFNATAFAEKAINKSRARMIRAMQRSETIRAAVEPVTDSVIITGAGLFLVVGYYVSGDAAATVLPKLILFILVLNRLMPRVKSYNRVRMQFANSLPMIDRVTEFLKTEGKSFIRQGGLPVDQLKEEIRFDDVTFRYPESDVDALKHISFVIGKGETVALVGASGAGKSTICDLLLGLYEPTRGRILVDGKDLTTLDLRSWLDKVGVVDQEVFLLDTTVRENIAFGAETYADEEVVDAAKAAHAHEFIIELPAGYETVVGDRGYRLSGGQKQRIALARALLGGPAILVMDEATSALDTASERKIQSTLRELHRARTLLLVAHRLSTIAHADRIITLRDGEVVEEGTREELLVKGGTFAELWNLQVKQAASR